MAEVVHNAYDAETMSITVSGEPGTDEAETFLRDKLCEQGLKMIEVYSEWAGKCEATSPLLRQLKAEKEYDPSVFVALSCCAESHEMLEEFRGQSLPHFIFFRNGVKKATVKGANVAAMKRYIVDYTPNVPEADDLEENPQLKKRKEEEAAAAARAQEELANIGGGD